MATTNYAWGETEPKAVYDWVTYKYCTVNDDYGVQTLTKYNSYSGYGMVDNLTTLEAIDDAATAKLGSGARIPTADEWSELVANTTSELTTLNGVYGCKLTSRLNDKSLFLSAAGFRYDNEFSDVGMFGNYWSASCSEREFAQVFGFDEDEEQDVYERSSSRCHGFSIRAVRASHN